MGAIGAVGGMGGQAEVSGLDGGGEDVAVDSVVVSGDGGDDYLLSLAC